MSEVLEAWKGKAAPPLPPLRIGILGFASFQTDKGEKKLKKSIENTSRNATLGTENMQLFISFFGEANEIECK
ncbi:hypothetical protein BSK20_03795 [SR1 bacterium human oral taxon HOT-345]|nr:hypothetical protein BSK20_03795 [SR1 bacterium human oral taxon HOT-345]